MGADTRGFDSKARFFVDLVESHGWSVRRTSKGHIMARTPEGTEPKLQVTIPPRMDSHHTRSSQNVKAAIQRWMRSNASETVRVIDAGHDARADGDDIAAEVMFRGAARKIEEAVPPAVTIDYDGPWMAHKRYRPDGGTRYESAAVRERRYSDGRVDYYCSLAPNGCEYESMNPKSVAVHYGKAHTAKGDEPALPDGATMVDPDYTEPLTSRTYNPTARLVEALAAWFSSDDRLDDGMLSPTTLAESALRWMHERPDLEDVEHASREPLTDAQIIERIRRLVSSPLESEVSFLRQQNERLIRERDDNAAALVAVQTDLAALREMFDSVGRRSA